MQASLGFESSLDRGQPSFGECNRTMLGPREYFSFTWFITMHYMDTKCSTVNNRRYTIDSSTSKRQGQHPVFLRDKQTAGLLKTQNGAGSIPLCSLGISMLNFEGSSL